MTNSGIRTVDYATGHSNRIEVAARRAVMTGISQLTGKISEYNAQKLGTEYFEVAWILGQEIQVPVISIIRAGKGKFIRGSS